MRLTFCYRASLRISIYWWKLSALFPVLQTLMWLLACEDPLLRRRCATGYGSIVMLNQIYSFDIDSLIQSIPKPEKMTKKDFDQRNREFSSHRFGV